MDSYTKLMTSIDEKYSGEEVEQSENIISLYDLVKMLEEEFGVSAAAPVAVAGPVAQEAAPVEEVQEEKAEASLKGEGSVGHTVFNDLYAITVQAQLKNEALFLFAYDDIVSIEYFGMWYSV